MLAALLCAVMVLSLLPVTGLAAASGHTGATTGVTGRDADPPTTDTYDQYLLGGKDGPNGSGSRYAGRIWSDKTVIAYDEESKGASISLDMASDGYAGGVTTDEDFLHVFSVLGSNQVVNGETTSPLDVVILLDISTSMTTRIDREGNTFMDENDALHKLIDTTNDFIDRLMGGDPNHTVHPENRVGVVVYGGGSQTMLELGHYSASNGDGKYLSITGKTDKNTGAAYFPQITTSVKELRSQKVSKYMLADATYLQGALYDGMKMLADANETTISDAPHKGEKRTPILIVMTDGATNLISATSTTKAGEPSYTWDAPYSGVVEPVSGGQYRDSGKNPFYADCNLNTGRGDTTYNGDRPGADKSKYRSSQTNRDLEVQAIAPRSVSDLLLAGYMQKKIQAHYGMDMQGYSLGFRVNGVTEFEKEQLYATLNPRVYFGDRTGLYSDSRALDERDAISNAIKTFISNNTASMNFPRTAVNGQTQHYYTGFQTASFTWNKVNDGNDIQDFSDIYYIDQYFTADDAEALSSVFDQIFEIVNGSAFTIVEGQNASTASNALTYMDPIGDYMEVKSIDNLLLFGTMYDVTQTAVYDYQWNEDYITKKLGQSHGTPFTPGWYSGETGDKGEYHATQQPGDVYRLDFKTTQQFVPTLVEKNSVDDMDAKQQHTVYTMYRLSGGGMDDENTRRLWRLNPAYADSTNVAYDPNTYILPGGTEAFTEETAPVGAYRLSDIRMWVEDTGNWQDTSGMASSAGYSEALWLNIPANAVPVQLATINLTPEGTVAAYGTNLGGDGAHDAASSDLWRVTKSTDQLYQESTPLRVFYSVGVEDDILYASGNIDMTKVDPDYITGHTYNGAVYFISNYFSGEETQGDPVLSFSPGSANRYYLFQKNLPLYKNPDNGAGGEVKLTNVGKADVTATLDGKELELVDEIGELDPNGDYYIVIDFYKRGSNEVVHLAVPRKGSDFGSGVGFGTAEFLCWLNLNGNVVSPDDVTAKPSGDTGDRWVIATKVGGLRTGNISEAAGAKTTNTTQTARNYIYPTIGSNDSGPYVNDYLGNNGWLRLQDTQLLVTKTVLPTESQPVDPNEPFDFQVFLQGVSGTVNAVVVQWDDFAELWRRRIGSIDVLTGNAGYAQSANGGHATVKYDLNGDGVEENCVVYLGNNEEVEDNTVRVYTSKEDATPVGGFTTYVTAEQINDAYKLTTPTSDYAVEDDDHPAGTRVFWCEAYLYDTSQEGYNPGAPAVPPEISERFKLVERFPIATLKLDEDYGLRSGIRIESPFAISWQYMTKEITFGNVKELYDDQGFQSAREPSYKEFSVETIKLSTAEFKLRDGEGLLFTGLPNQTNYRVTERLTQEQASKGYTLHDAKVVMYQNYHKFSLSDTKIPEDQWPTSPPESRDPGYAKLEGGYDFENDYEGVTGKISEPTPNPAYTQKTLDNSAYFDAENNVYSVFKDTSTAESAAHFTNTFAPKTLTIAKELSAAPGAEITDEDKNTPFYFSAEIKLTKDPAEYPVTFPLTRYKASGEPYPETEVLPQPAAIDLEDEASENDLPQDVITGYVQVEDKDGKATFMEVNSAGKLVPLNDGNANAGKLELLPGERVVIYGLPVDTGYSFTITEDQVNGYVPTITGGDVDGYSVSGSVGVEGEAAATVTFTNVKQPIEPAYVSLSATKTLNNKDLADEEFTFEIAPVAGNPAGDPIAAPKTVYNGLDGVVQLFNDVKYDQVGEYNYTVRELIPNPTEPGITYDTTIHTITVIIEPQGEGEHYTSHLQASLKIDGGEPITGTDEGGHYTFGPATIITFTNDYEPGIATAVLQARKLYLGGEMEGEDFTFVLTPVTAQVEDDTEAVSNEDEEQGSDLEIAPPSNGGEQQEQPGAGDPADPEASPEPSATAEPTPVTPAEPEASDAPEATAAPEVDDTPEGGDDGPQDDPDTTAMGGQEPPSYEGQPSDTPEDTPAPDESEATETPAPTDTPAPSDTPEPSETPKPTDTAEPSETPEATQTPEATETPAGEPEGDPDDNEIMPVDLVPMDDADMPMPGGQKGGTAEGKNDKFGNVIFDSIKFTEPGIYYYKITEQPTGDNIEYDERVIFAKVIVTAVSDSEPKELTASVEYLSSMDEDHPGEADVPMTGTPQFTNINTEPVKTEPDPGPDMPVQVGDVVTYRVTWYNDKDVAATVTVRDRLDPGVTYNAGTAVAYCYEVDDDGNVTEVLMTVNGTYDSDKHTITWELGEQPSMATGYVEFKVTVNENAKYEWKYDEDTGDHTEAPTGPDDVNRETDEDFRIVNQAALKIGDENWQWTEIIPNPTWEPEKDSEPKSGTTVHVGEHIFYWITWQNYLAQAAEITITDVLDPGLTYVEGTAMAYEGEHGAGGKPLNDTNGNQIRGIYDPYTRTIEWKLGTQDPNKFGYVMFEAEVNNDALQDDATVKNDATVKVGEHSFQTNEVEHYVDGRLLVTKYVSGNSGETTRDFHFTVTLTPPTGDQALWDSWDGSCVCILDGEPVEDFAFTENDDGSYSATFTLRHNQTASINGLPVGAGYTVTETDANSDGYTTTYERATGTIGSGDSTPHAVITNTKDVYTPPPGPGGTPEPSTTPTPSTSPSPSPTPDGQPHKVETDPGDGQMVVPDQWVTYEITWENTHAESATVTIWDTLDPNVEFVSASEGYTYDPATHTVTWVLPDRAGGSTGSVTVTVRVLPSAVQAGIIRNQAHVQVGDDPAQDTEIPENPLTPPSPSPVAPSPTPSSGIPDTGDSSRPGLWLALLTVSLMGLGLIGGATLRRRKREK